MMNRAEEVDSPEKKDVQPQSPDQTAGADSTPPPTAASELRRTQTCWRFFHEGGGPLADTCSYALRQRIKAALPDWPHLSASLRTGARSVTISARHPVAAAWMVKNVGRLMGVVATEAERDLQVDVRTMLTGVRKSTPILYTIPELIVSRSKKRHEWAAWCDDILDEEHQAVMTTLIQEGLLAEIHRWGLAPGMTSLGGVTVINPGREKPIVPAEGPRGMGRLRVQFVAPWDLDGEFFVGHHTLMGYGLVIKGGAVGAQPADSSNEEDKGSI